MKAALLRYGIHLAEFLSTSQSVLRPGDRLLPKNEDLFLDQLVVAEAIA
jgi:hypothetical protein